MTTATSNAPATVTGPAFNPWRRVLRVAAAATIVLSVAHQWLNRFFGISLVALAVLLAVGLLLDLSQRRAGPVLLVATSLLFLVLHIAILVLVLRYADIAETFITVWGLVVGLSLTLAAAIQTLRSHGDSTDRSTRTATVVAIVACGAWAAVGVYSLAERMDIENVQPGPGDVVVDVSDRPKRPPTSTSSQAQRPSSSTTSTTARCSSSRPPDTCGSRSQPTTAGASTSTSTTAHIATPSMDRTSGSPAPSRSAEARHLELHGAAPSSTSPHHPQLRRWRSEIAPTVSAPIAL